MKGLAMRVLITGNMGYVGPVVVAHLRATFPEADLIGYDTALFGAQIITDEPLPERRLSRQIFGDVRDLPPALLEGVDVVVHLSAISNDPMGNRFEAATESINYAASVRLAEAARAAGVPCFVFASSCSVYGAADGPARREGDSLNPLTAYARSKIGTEEALMSLDTGDMTITCLRFATACGMSPRLRLDLVLNDFVAAALTSGEVKVLSDGTPWRPLIDVADMARAIEWAMGRDAAAGGRFLTINTGADRQNYQVSELAETVAQAVPGTTVSINREAPPDRRSYRVDFGLYRELAPAHQPQVSLADSVSQLYAGLRGARGLSADFRRSDAMRLYTLERHIEAGRLGIDIRWTDAVRAADHARSTAQVA
jgi:nucleoside-diphosphate-sugar epimerase